MALDEKKRFVMMNEELMFEIQSLQRFFQIGHEATFVCFDDKYEIYFI